MRRSPQTLGSCWGALRLASWCLYGTSLVPVPARCSVAAHHQKEPAPIGLIPTIEIFMNIAEVPSQHFLLQADQPQVSQPFPVQEMLQAPRHLCGSLLDSLEFFAFMIWVQSSRCGLARAEQGERITFLILLATLF